MSCKKSWNFCDTGPGKKCPILFIRTSRDEYGILLEPSSRFKLQKTVLLEMKYQKRMQNINYQTLINLNEKTKLKQIKVKRNMTLNLKWTKITTNVCSMFSPKLFQKPLVSVVPHRKRKNFMNLKLCAVCHNFL